MIAEDAHLWQEQKAERARLLAVAREAQRALLRGFKRGVDNMTWFLLDRAHDAAQDAVTDFDYPCGYDGFELECDDV